MGEEVEGEPARGQLGLAGSLTEAIRALDSIPLGDVLSEIDTLESRGASDPTLVTYLRERYNAPHEAPPAKEGDVVGGRYRIIKQLGVGGMGQVYVAEQTHVNRRVALKMISPALATEPMIHRMAGEIASLGRLNHAGIVRVYDADVHRDGGDGPSSLYFTMEIVDGDTIDRWARGGPGPVNGDSILECFARVCDAVAFAHDRGVVHRDIKPGNIMVRPDGTPAVLDFGIASVRDANLERAARQAGVGESVAQPVPGTPYYMSPSKWNRVDDLEAGDVFALGVVLFELLAGRRPWQLPASPSLENICHAIVHGMPGRLRGIAPKTEPALDGLIARMLDKEPDRRPTAREAGGEIRRVLERRRRRAWLARTAPAIATVAVLVAGAAALAGRQFYVWLKRSQSEAVYMRALDVMESPGIDPATWLERHLPKANLRHDDEVWRDLVVRAFAAWRFLPTGVAGLAPREVLVGSDPSFEVHVTYSAATGVAVSAGGERIVPPPDLAGRYRSPPAAAAVCPGRPLVALRSASGAVDVWDYEGGAVVDLGGFPGGESALGFSPDGGMLACGATVPAGDAGTRGQVFVWRTGDWEGGELLEPDRDGAGRVDPQGGCRSVTRLAWGGGGRYLATCGGGSSMALVWGFDGDRWTMRSAKFHQAPVTALAWNSSGSVPLLATGRSDGVVAVWREGRESAGTLIASDPIAEFGDGAAATLVGSGGDRGGASVAGLAWLPGGAECLAVSAQGRAVSWSLRQASDPVRRFDLGHRVERLGWSGEARVLSVDPGDGGTVAWNWWPGVAGSQVHLPFDVTSLDLDARGRWLAAGSDKGIGAGAALVEVRRLGVVSEWTDRLSGPVRFEPGDGAIWLFHRSRGLLRVPADEWGEGTGAIGGTVIAKPETASSGSVAFSGDGRVAMVLFGQTGSEFRLAGAGAARAERLAGDGLVISSALGVQMELDQEGDWLAVLSGRQRLASFFRRARAGTWERERGLTLEGDGGGEGIAFAFSGSNGGLLEVLRPPRLERWSLPGNRRIEAFELGQAPRGAGADMVVAGDSWLVRAGDSRPLLVSSGGGEIERIAALGRPRGADGNPVTAMRISSDGRIAAVAEKCLHGTVVELWNVETISETLDSKGFDPVALQRVEVPGAGGGG